MSDNRDDWKDTFNDQTSDSADSSVADFHIDPSAFALDADAEYIDQSAVEEAALTQTDSYVDESWQEDETYQPPVQETQPVEERALVYMRRRRTGLMGGLMYALFVLSISIILGSVAWIIADDVLGLTKPEMLAVIEIPEDFTLEEVADALVIEGLVNHRALFLWFGRMFDAEERIQPGLYQVETMDFRALIGSLNQGVGARFEYRVLIPEGRTVQQTFETLEENNIATVRGLNQAMMEEDFTTFEFLRGVDMTRDNWLEGFLFPDTYTFYLHQDPAQVIRTMLRNFRIRMQQNDNEVFDLLEESEYSLQEILTIASMIEREAANVEEMPRIASVIYNRLNNPEGETAGFLQIDATILYGLDEHREILRVEDIQNPHPWNTYVHRGLPPTPIANPGLASILAALQPEDTNFLFYALHTDGTHRFFPNYAQHSAFVASADFADFAALQGS